MKRFILIINCIFLLTSLFATDDEAFGSILFYAGRENVKKTELSHHIGSDLTYKFYYSDKDFFRVYYSSKFKILKKIKAGTYHITKAELVVRVGKPDILDDLDVTITVRPNETVIFPLRVYYDIKQNNDLVVSWKSIIRSMSDDDYKVCNEYLTN